MLQWPVCPVGSSHHQAMYFRRKFRIPTGPGACENQERLLCSGGRSPAYLRACLAGSGRPSSARALIDQSLPGLESHPEVHAARGVRRPRWRCPDDRLGGPADLRSVCLACG